VRLDTRRPWALIGVLLAIGCGESDTAAPNVVGTELLSVVPAGGSTSGTDSGSGARSSPGGNSKVRCHFDGSGLFVYAPQRCVCCSSPAGLPIDTPPIRAAL
jgi:hypothetical protein